MSGDFWYLHDYLAKKNWIKILKYMSVWQWGLVQICTNIENVMALVKADQLIKVKMGRFPKEQYEKEQKAIYK